MIKACVIGATGYVGEELCRLLKRHPGVQIIESVSKSFSGKSMGDIYINFAMGANLPLSDLDVKKLASTCDVAFLCMPHTQSFAIAPVLLAAGLKVIDLSADFRYDNADTYEQWYGVEHTAKDLMGDAVYGLPEYFRQRIANARLVANPGCYTTASILALAPLLKAGLVSPDGIVIDAKSGVSGAGRKESLDYAFCETADNFKAYSVTKHRHTSEIEEQLSSLSENDITLLFTPHLLPVKRGILATTYTQLAPGTDVAKIASAYEQAYSGEPFAHILPTGRLPELKQVVGSNHCVIGYDISDRTNRLIIVSCLDNLIKGAAGQAIQNLNIMFGLDEKAGLPEIAWYL